MGRGEEPKHGERRGRQSPSPLVSQKAINLGISIKLPPLVFPIFTESNLSLSTLFSLSPDHSSVFTDTAAAGGKGDYTTNKFITLLLVIQYKCKSTATLSHIHPNLFITKKPSSSTLSLSLISNFLVQFLHRLNPFFIL